MNIRTILLRLVQLTILSGCVILFLVAQTWRTWLKETDSLNNFAVIPGSTVSPIQVFFVNFLLVISILGFLGTLKNYHPAQCVFAIGLMLLNAAFWLQPSTLGSNSAYANTREVITKMVHSLEGYDWGRGGSEEATQNVDAIQRLGCCGIYNAEAEWANHRPYDLTEQDFPASCCDPNSPMLKSYGLKQVCSANKSTRPGCYDHVQKLTLTHLHASPLFGIFLASLVALSSLRWLLECSVAKARELREQFKA